VNEFIEILEKEFGISTTPRVRRGIDINAGCGQLKSKIQKKEQEEQEVVDSDLKSFLDVTKPPMIGVYQDEQPHMTKEVVGFQVDAGAVDFDSDDYEAPEFENEWEHQEAARLISLVERSFPSPTKTTSITDTDAIRESKRRRKKLLKNLKAIVNLQDLEKSGKVLNDEQQLKVSRLEEYMQELESVQHNFTINIHPLPHLVGFGYPKSKRFGRSSFRRFNIGSGASCMSSSEQQCGRRNVSVMTLSL
jgi:hypothetical protein